MQYSDVQLDAAWRRAPMNAMPWPLRHPALHESITPTHISSTLTHVFNLLKSPPSTQIYTHTNLHKHKSTHTQIYTSAHLQPYNATPTRISTTNIFTYAHLNQMYGNHIDVSINWGPTGCLGAKEQKKKVF